MNSVLLIAAGALALLILAKGLVTVSPRTLARNIKQILALTLLIFGGFMALTGRWLVAIPLIVSALGALLPVFLAGKGSAPFGIGRRAPTGRRSTVRSAALEMELDHDSGVISGRVLAGRFEGRDLARLSIADLKALWAEIRGDPESRALLEAYLDRRDPLWREDLHGDATAGQRGAPASGAMTDQEAYQILGLQPGAGEAEIREAHRRLMKAVHPDRGGSNFLAAKINEAKDRLVGKHGTRSNH